jgi:hypothetical protein
MRNELSPQIEPSDSLAEYTPEQDLVMAVMKTAIDDLYYGDQQARDSSIQWISIEDDSWFSFVWCCQMLDVNHEIIRRKIQNDKDRL